MTRSGLREPWKSFLKDVDAALSVDTELHCLGGFIAAELYGLARPTADVDVLEAIGTSPSQLEALAGRGSGLHRRHGVYLQFVGGVASVPQDYRQRLVDVDPREFRKLRVRALEKHDLVLAKLPRNSDRDREDLRQIALSVGLVPDVLRVRYERELRYQSTNTTRDDGTLALWLEIVEEVMHRNHSS